MKKKIRYGIQILVFCVLAVLAALYYFRRDELDIYMEGGEYGYVNTSGEAVIEYQFVDADGFSEGLATVSMDENYGFIDTTGTIVIEPKYGYAGNFYEGLAWVLIDGRYGFIDKTGQIVIEPKYEELHDFSEGMARFAIDGIYGYIDKEERMIVPQFDFAGDFSEGMAWVEKDDKYGFINKAGELIVGFDYDNAYDFSEGLARVRIGEWPDVSYSYIDKNGEVVIGFDYEEAGDFSEGLAYVKRDSKYGYIDKLGQLVIDYQFDNAFSFHEGLAAVRVDDCSCDKYGKDHDGDLMGYIDKTGQFVIEPCFEVASNFSEGYAIVDIDPGHASNIIDKEGNLIGIVDGYSYESEFKQGLCPFFNRSRYGLCKTSGRHLTDAIYEDLYIMSDNFVSVELNGKYGLINGRGKALTEIIYDYVGYFNKNKAYVVLDDLTGLVDKKGRTIVEPQYDEIGYFDYDFDRAMVSKDGKYGYINEKGEVVVEIIYDDAPYFFDEDGEAEVIFEGRRRVIDKDGNVRARETWDEDVDVEMPEYMDYREVETIEPNPLPVMPSDLDTLVQGTGVDLRNSAYGILRGIMAENQDYYEVQSFGNRMIEHFVTYGFIDIMLDDPAITNVRFRDFNECVDEAKEDEIDPKSHGCDNELKGWGYTWMNSFANELLASEKLQNILYDWLKPELLNLYNETDVKVKMCMTDVVNHMIEYTAHYDHSAECSFYYDCVHSRYGEDLFNFTCEIEDMEPNRHKIENPYRPFETWVFRRVCDGTMTAAQIHSWLIRIRKDLNLGGLQQQDKVDMKNKSSKIQKK